MKQIWLVRHAESVANAGGATPDPVSIPLTDKGQDQAKKLASAFVEKPDLFITSPFLRTKQTAAPTLAKFPDVPAEEWAVQEFSYLSPVVWANTSSEDRAPRTDHYWEECDPDYHDGDGAESFNDLIGRVDNAMIDLYMRPEKRIVMFSHGQFLKALWMYLVTDIFKINPKDRMKKIDLFIKAVNFPNTGILKMVNISDGEGWLLSSLSTKHLGR